MIFDTFLDRFELRTGCFVVSTLHLAFIILTLHFPLVTNFKVGFFFYLISTIEKLFETILTMVLIYAVYHRNRKLILGWQVMAPLMFLFNVLDIAYISMEVVNLSLFLFIAVPMYLITYNMMLVNSYYEELGYIGSYLADMEYVRAENFQINQITRSNSQTLNTEGSSNVQLSRNARI